MGKKIFYPKKGITNRMAVRLFEFSDRAKDRVFGDFLRRLYKIGIGPNTLTIAGLVCAIAANLVLRTSRPWFVVLLLAYIFIDMLDGASARANKCFSEWGNIFDFAIDIFIAIVTILNVGFFSGYELIAALSLIVLLFQDWFYSIMLRMNLKYPPLQTYLFAYFFILIGKYLIAFYVNIAVSVAWLLIGFYLFAREIKNARK